MFIQMHNKNLKIPDSLSRLFQEYQFEEMDIHTHSNTIIERTLENGTWEELYWLFHTFGIKQIAEYLSEFGHRRLSKITFNYWQTLLQVKSYKISPWQKIRDDVWQH